MNEPAPRYIFISGDVISTKYGNGILEVKVNMVFPEFTRTFGS
jgi:hypothetical protein